MSCLSNFSSQRNLVTIRMEIKDTNKVHNLLVFSLIIWLESEAKNEEKWKRFFIIENSNIKTARLTDNHAVRTCKDQ